MMKIVIASDSFKGSLSSIEVADSAERAIHRIAPTCEVVKIPIADGGEGTAQTLVGRMGSKMVSCLAFEPLHKWRTTVSYGIADNNRTAIIETASASGLSLVPPPLRNPLYTSTFGTGEMILDALNRGCRHFLIGLGGSATNDAGTGMLQALGYRFLDEEGQELPSGGRILNRIMRIDDSHAVPELRDATFTVACDVNNPFSGSNGAAYVYARQKGADDETILQLDNGLKQFAAVVLQQRGIDINSIPGAGAAGGLGGAFLAFLDATLKPGIEMVLEAVDFDRLIADADLVITGEGRLDRQTAMGKAPGGVLRAARRQQIPVIAIGGSVEDATLLNRQGFLAVFAIQQEICTLNQAMEKGYAMSRIEATVEQIVRIIQHYQP
ncbi:MAG: glycerate kinase [Prevotellaceae bacterium]|jgi:glycerate kinase|nr:glycerate kinase [Prevotellaceae bacterium]